ncbi:MAG: hypothetical protein ACI8T1_001866 [Verrucomicrobiales bacterium]
MKFESDFDFTHGGKLHVLGPKEKVTGGREGRKDGWSARVTFAKEGGVKTYNYHQHQPGQYGEGGKAPPKSFRFPKDKWVSVSLHVRVNENPKKKTGFSKLYVNGKLIESMEKVQWRAEGGKDTLINNFLFSTFHGGSADKWTPKDKDGKWIKVHALFDNIAVYRGERIRKAPGK